MKTTNYKINTNLVLQTLDEKLVVFDADKSMLYTFNETAELIFSKIKLGWDDAKILAMLTKKYNIPLARLKKDLNEITKDMVKHKIIYKK